VMFADAEHVEACLVGELDLLEEVPQPFGRVDRTAGRCVGSDVCEGIEAEFHGGHPALQARQIEMPPAVCQSVCVDAQSSPSTTRRRNCPVRELAAAPASTAFAAGCASSLPAAGENSSASIFWPRF